MVFLTDFNIGKPSDAKLHEICEEIKKKECQGYVVTGLDEIACTKKFILSYFK